MVPNFSILQTTFVCLSIYNTIYCSIYVLKYVENKQYRLVNDWTKTNVGRFSHHPLSFSWYKKCLQYDVYNHKQLIITNIGEVSSHNKYNEFSINKHLSLSWWCIDYYVPLMKTLTQTITKDYFIVTHHKNTSINKQ